MQSAHFEFKYDNIISHLKLLVLLYVDDTAVFGTDVTVSSVYDQEMPQSHTADQPTAS